MWFKHSWYCIQLWWIWSKKKMYFNMNYEPYSCYLSFRWSSILTASRHVASSTHKTTLNRMEEATLCTAQWHSFTTFSHPTPTAYMGICTEASYTDTYRLPLCIPVRFTQACPELNQWFPSCIYHVPDTGDNPMWCNILCLYCIGGCSHQL